MKYKVNEIFYSLQGEGHHTGTPAVFIRFSGCNLHCEWCDTNFSEYALMTEAEIVTECRRLQENCMLLLTGGEPALHADEALIDALREAGYTCIAIETNGTKPLPKGIDWVTCSPKEGTRVVLQEADEVKVVYTGQDVEKWRERISAKYHYLQPCSQQNTKHIVRYILNHPWWRLSLQTQKYIGMK
ncbi:MAG: radical SAM protein [Paludibacteraceae bacterium]|nr:radical SAM protein [Paludibacteraceae bacterium]